MHELRHDLLKNKNILLNVGKTDERKMACTANQDNEGEKTVVI